MNRRQFIASAVTIAALHYAQRVAEYFPPTLAIIDERIPFSKEFADICVDCGINVRPMHDDIADTWYREIAMALPSATVVGMTRPAEFQVFSLLAHERHARLRYCGLHCQHRGTFTQQIRSSCEIETFASPGTCGHWSTQAIQLVRAAHRKSAPIPLSVQRPCFPGYSFITWALA